MMSTSVGVKHTYMQFVLTAFVFRRTRDSQWNNFIEAVSITALRDVLLLSAKIPASLGRQFMSCGNTMDRTNGYLRSREQNCISSRPVRHCSSQHFVNP